MLPRIARVGFNPATRSRRKRVLERSKDHLKRCVVRFSTSPSSSSASSQEVVVPEESSSEYGLYSLLSDAERQCLQEQREITALSQSLAAQVGITTTAYSASKSLLDELSTFSVVIAGEFNAGKSTLINALLGTKLLESGALPTTDTITIVSHADNTSIVEIPMGVDMHTSSLPLLEDLTLVDTPGTNSAWMDHTERTLNLLPAADLILFITSADRPFSESEKSLLEQIQTYRKHIVVVVNKMDILDAAGGDHGKEQKQAIVDFVSDHASELLGARPIVLPVSSRNALSAKLMQKKTYDTNTNSDDGSPQQQQQYLSNMWHRSNFQALETFLQDTLTTEAKLKSKLTTPIGVAEGVVTQCVEALKDRRSDLEADIATLSILQAQFEGWKKELSADLDQSRQNMTELVREEGVRCELLLERLNVFQFHAWALWNTSQLEREWEATKRQASAHRQQSLETDLLEQVQETANSIATRGRAQGQAVIEYLGKRPAMKNQSLVGSVTAASRFEDTRKNLGERLSSAVMDSLKTTTTKTSTINNEDPEKIHLFASLRQTAMLSSLFQVGTAGTVLSAVATQWIDPMGAMLLASSCTFSSGATYMAGTSMIGKSHQKQWSQRANVLDRSLQLICQKELDRVHRKILDGVAPYTRFVESEKEQIDKLQDECDTILAGARSLRNKVDKIR